MSIETVIALSNLSADEIASRYNKNQLTSFYIDLYGLEPRSTYRKIDLAYACWQFIADSERTKDLCKLLR